MVGFTGNSVDYAYMLAFGKVNSSYKPLAEVEVYIGGEIPLLRLWTASHGTQAGNTLK